MLLNNMKNSGWILVAIAACSGVALSGQTLFVPSGTSGISSSTTANVGIGTANPAQMLEIAAPSGGNAWEILRRPDTNQMAGIGFSSASAADWFLGTINNNTSDLTLFSYGITASVLTISKNTGNVGIGTSSPAAKMDIAGNIRLSSSWPQIEFNDGGARIGDGNTANTLVFYTGGGFMHGDGVDAQHDIRVHREGI